MTRVLVAGETWVSHATHYKGFDAFSSVTFHTGIGPLRAALSSGGVELTHLPAHDVPAAFPATPEELGVYDVVVLSDIGANSILLHPDTWLAGAVRPNRLAVLADWVRGGGGLAMAGGYLSFQGIEGKARFHDTPVEQVLPCEIAPVDDRVEAPEGVTPAVADGAHPVLGGVQGTWPRLLGYNRFAVKPAAQTLATVNGDPLLAVWEVGAGRALAWASDIGPHWCPDEFTAWDGYATLFRNAVAWLAGK